MKIKLKNLINGYEDAKEELEGVVTVSKGRFFSRRVSGSFTAGASALRSLDETNLLRRMWRAVAYTSARAFASLFLSFGVLTMFLNLVATLFSSRTPAPVPIIVGVALAALSIPMFFLDGPLIVALQRNRATNYLFFDFFGMKRVVRDDGRRGYSPITLALIGAFFAGAGYLLPFHYVTAIMLGSVLVYLSVESPEFPLFSGIFILPIMPVIPYSEVILAVVGAVMSLSFLLKVAEGKRTLVIEQYDIVLFLMMTVVLISGIFLGGVNSFGASLTVIGASFAYFVTSCAVTNRRLAECVLHSFLFSSLAPAVVAIAQLAHTAADIGFKAAFALGSCGTLGSRSELGAFLALAVFAAIYFIKESHGASRAMYVLLVLLDLAAIALCATGMALIALLAGLFTLLIIRVKHLSAILLLLIILAPYGLVFLVELPWAQGAARFIFARDSSEILSVWENAARLIRENLFFGVGIGGESLRTAMTDIGAPSASAGNLLLGMACQAGVLAPLLFVMMIAIRVRHRSKYGVYLAESSVGSLCDVTAAASIAILTLGATDFLFSSSVLFYLYLCVFGLGSAALRISRDDYDNRNNYYRYLRRSHSAEIYVDLRRF